MYIGAAKTAAMNLSRDKFAQKHVGFVLPPRKIRIKDPGTLDMAMYARELLKRDSGTRVSQVITTTNTAAVKMEGSEGTDEVEVTNGGVVTTDEPDGSMENIEKENGSETTPYELPKVCDDDEDHLEWQNETLKLYAEQFTQDVLEKRLEEQFKEAMKAEASLLDKLKRNVGGTENIQINGRPLPKCVGGTGFVTVVNRPKFPLNDFFRAGRCWRLRLRHSNLTSSDDAALDGRVVCLKFSDDETGGPFDLIMHTGRVAPYFNSRTFHEYIAAHKTGEEAVRDFAIRSPCHWNGIVDNLRRAPKSYYDLRYYSHAPYEFKSEDKVKRIARFRLMPADGSDETGLPDLDDQKNFWTKTRRENERQSMNYLRIEYGNRLENAALQYRLQIQVRTVGKNELNEVLNPCMEWNKKFFPWFDLAVVTVALPLPEVVVARTKYSLLNIPKELSLPPAPGSNHFHSLAHEMGTFMGNMEKSFKVNPDDLEDEIKVKYVVTVCTGNVKNAGTDADIYIILTGTNGRSNRINLDNAMVDDFETGQTDVFEVEVTPVGEIITVQMELSSMLSREWFLDYVTVLNTATQSLARFPCYQWLTTQNKSIMLRRAEAILAHQEMSAFSYLQRKYELEEKKKIFKWEKMKGLPSRLAVKNYDSLPKEVKFFHEKESDLRGKYVRTLANTGVGTLKVVWDTWDIFNDNEKLLTSLLKENNRQDKKIVRHVSKIWREDVEFGRQFLNGFHPTRIRRMTSIPGTLPLTEEMIAVFLDRGMSLQEEIEAGHMYFVSYPELAKMDEVMKESADAKKPRFFVAPICVFYVTRSGFLRPIAIQLHQVSSGENPIWTPGDSECDWLTAKMWVREADAQLHQVVSRHLMTHLFMEAICVATHRHLPAVHPVYKLLVPHLRYTLAVNVLGRDSLYPAEEGLFDKYLAVGRHYEHLAKESYKKFTLEDLHIEKDFANRGVADFEALPNYHYREDSLLLWKIIKKFVRTSVFLHYWTPQNINSDEELQAWIFDIYSMGMPVYPGCGTSKGIPKNFSNLDELIDFLTTIVYTASARNAALTGPMMDYYGYIPNAPTMMMAAAPSLKGVTTEDDLKKSLPSRQKCAEIIAACYTLSRFSKDERFLGEFPEDHFYGDAISGAIIAFQEDLKIAAQTIEERNKTLDIPYTYLMPENIPNSVAQ